jgi:ABC-type lipoprotein release transport system permease subunit
MRKLIEVARTGVDAIALHPLRGLVTVACVVAVLTPFLVGMGISHGLRRQARLAVAHGADVYVTGARFGRPAPVPVTAVEALRDIDGVLTIRPRIVGEVILGRDRLRVVLVGIDPDGVDTGIDCVRGRLFATGAVNELIVGTELARRLALDVGTRIPPFYRSSRGERVSTVVGVFQADASIWQSNLVLTSFQTASEIFDQPDAATELLITCRPGYEQSVATAVSQANVTGRAGALDGLTLRTMTRSETAALLPAGMLRAEGIFSLHFVLAFAVGIPLVLVVSGVGLRERRREIGILKATGWQTDEVLLRGLVESLLLGIAAAAASILIAFVWLRVFNGVGVAAVFLSGVGIRPSFPVPFQLAPLPVFLAVLVALAVVLTGTLYTSWRTAVVPPAAAMRW